MEQVHKLWKMKTTRSSKILKIHHNGGYLLFGKKKLQIFKIS